VAPREVVGHAVEDGTAAGDVTVGMTGTTALFGTTMGDTLTIGTAAAELTPKLPISIDPSGIPARAMPPGVVGVVGAEDKTTLLEPEPHIPDIPEVSSIPDVADVPDVADIPGEVDIPKVAAVAGAVIPTPPPS
jgi:hypothetical protein